MVKKNGYEDKIFNRYPNNTIIVIARFYYRWFEKQLGYRNTDRAFSNHLSRERVI